MTADHECTYPEVLIQAGDFGAGDPLQAGMRVLAPCPMCGETALEWLSWAEHHLKVTEEAFSQLAVDRGLQVFHWAPTARRRQIIRHGLLPGRRPTTHASPAWRAPYVCFADTPRWAWGLSGGQRSAPSGSWDLWEAHLSDLTNPKILPMEAPNGIHEIRTHHRVFKRHLWLVGTKEKKP